MARVLSFSSGGTYGALEAGMAHALAHERNVEWDAFYGSSCGAINAAFMSCFESSREGSERLCEFWKRVASLWKRPDVSWCTAVTALCHQKSGMNSSKTLEFILNNMPLHRVATKPLFIAATQEPSSASVLFQIAYGDVKHVKKVLRASTAIPVIWNPVRIQNNFYVDGTVSMPIPYPTEIAERTAVQRIDFVVVPPDTEEFLRRPGMIDIAVASGKGLLTAVADAELETARLMFGKRAFMWYPSKRLYVQGFLRMDRTEEIIEEGRWYVLEKEHAEMPHRQIPVIMKR